MKDSSYETLGTVAVGGTTSVENSACRLNGAGSSATVSGNTFTLNVSITFKPAFAGTEHFYVNQMDAGNLNSGWVSWGWWSVPGGN